MSNPRRYATIASVALVVLGTISGCGASGQYTWVDNAPADFFRPPVLLTISVGDVVSIRVFGQEPLSVRVPVRSDGVVTMPLIGDVAVAGKSPGVVAKEVESRLVPFVTTPNVVVVVEEAKTRIVAIGELRRNGSIVLEAGETGLLDAIANAGGLTEFAGESRVFVLRTDNAGIHRIRFEYEDIIHGVGRASAFRLRAGDQLVVE
jgi:polysaccharide export outer membrane protein